MTNLLCCTRPRDWWASLTPQQQKIRKIVAIAASVFVAFILLIVVPAAIASKPPSPPMPSPPKPSVPPLSPRGGSTSPPSQLPSSVPSTPSPAEPGPSTALGQLCSWDSLYLPMHVTPRQYNLHLTLFQRGDGLPYDRIRGTVDIAVEVESSTSCVVVHATGMLISAASYMFNGSSVTGAIELSRWTPHASLTCSTNPFAFTSI